VSLNAIKVEFPDSVGLHTKPMLIWQIYSPTSEKRDLIISYLTGGLSWSANSYKPMPILQKLISDPGSTLTIKQGFPLMIQS
jgi:hypothetical protein